MNIKQTLETYEPHTSKEQYIKRIMLNQLRLDSLALTRETRLHFTTSAIVVNQNRTKCIAIYHRIYDSWCWIGGHLDGNDDPLAVIKREIQEESGLKNFNLIGGGPICIGMYPVDAHIRRGTQVLPHDHLDLAYVFEANDKDPLKTDDAGVSGVKWMTIPEFCAECSKKEAFMVEDVYSKIFKRIGINI